MIKEGGSTMKRFFPVFLLVAFSAVGGCCVHAGLKHPEARQTIVDELKSDTVALVHKDSDGDVSPWCTGVWIDKDKVITADHCVRAPIEALVVELMPGDDVDDNDDEAMKAFQAAREKMVQDLEDGFKIQYIVDKESTGVYREPKAVHTLRVVKHDKAHDLALLVVDDPKDVPAHHVASLADNTPAVGETVHVMGHVTGLYWTYTRGLVAAYREENFRPVEKRGKKGPFMQIAGEVFRGNSGGGAFNDNGELVGLASFMPPAPNECFFVHIETIRSFLGRPIPR